MKNLKKLFFAVFAGTVLLNSVACKPNSKLLKEIEGKDGLFALLTTEQGEVLLKLFYEETPLTVTNFVGLAEGTLDATGGKPFYDGLKFHRVISKSNGDDMDFMIQGGDPEGTGRGGPGYRFADEFVDSLVFDKPGKLAMANSGAATNGSQFFITIAPTEWLNGRHTIFGEVVAGQSVVDNVKQNDTIKSIKIIRQGKNAENFTATQSDFDRIAEKIKKAEEEKKARQFAVLIDGCVKNKNGIYYQILEEGKGSACGKKRMATVEYIGYLADGRIFDASKGFHPEGGEALTFATDGKQMIPGFDLMVQEMKVGETRKIVIPPELAWGRGGMPQAGIRGDDYVCFDIKLVKIQ